MTFLASNYIFQAYLCYNMHYQLTSSSGCSQALHGTDAPHLVSHSSTDGHLGCLHFLAVMNNTIYDFCTSFCLNICLQFSWTALYLGEELLDHMGTWQLTFWVTVRLFSKLAVPFYMPTLNAWGFQFLTSLQILVIAHSFYYSHLSGHEIVSHYFDFDLHVLMTNGVEHLFMCLLAIFL